MDFIFFARSLRNTHFRTIQQVFPKDIARLKAKIRSIRKIRRANDCRASRKTRFCDFFEIATSCNSLDYRELQHRIFKVTSKN